MKKIIILLFIVVAIGKTSDAQSGIWMSGSGITGEGTGIHASEFQVLALQNLMVDTVINTGGGGFQVRWGIEDLKFKIPFNKSSVSFFSAFRSGLNLTSITVKFWYQKPDATFSVWTTILMENVSVRGYKILAPECAGNSCGIPFLEIALNWRKLTLSDDFGNLTVFDKQSLNIQ